MNSNVHPLVVTLVLVLTAIAIGTWMWGSGAAANIGGPAELRIDADGHAFVQIQSLLIEHDEKGEYLKTHNARDIDVDVFLGGFDFFSNGDVLLRRGPDPRSFGDNFRAFQRKTNDKSIEPENDAAGLFRCDLSSKSCSRFGTVGIDIKAAYGIFIDRRTDDVYLSDTTRHVLRKYSSDGQALTDPVSGFKFPNQLLLHEDTLYVADTNNHVVRSVDPRTALFGTDIQQFDVVPMLASEEGRRWPVHIARSNGIWWVNIMRAGMNQGAVYMFDDHWQLIRKLQLAEGADPISILSFDNEIWISDWYNDKVLRFAANGEPLADLQSAGLERVLAKSRIERRNYEFISYSGIALIILVLAGLLIRGLSVGMTTHADDSGKQETQSLAQQLSVHLEPDAKAVRRMHLAQRLFLILMLGVIGLTIYIVLFHDNPAFAKELWPTICILIAVFAAIVWVAKANKGTSVSVSNGVVSLRDHTGRESSCTIHDVRFDESAIATRDVVVFFGGPMASVYRREDLEEALFPVLEVARKVSPLEMQKILIELRHPQGITAVIALVGVIAYCVWLAVTSIHG